MSLNSEQRRQTRLELAENLALSGLDQGQLAERLGWSAARVEQALSVSGGQPADVWAVRDELSAVITERGGQPIEFTVLTENMRGLAGMWFDVPQHPGRQLAQRRPGKPDMSERLILSQQSATSAELYGNLALSGLELEQVAVQMGWLPPRVQRALDVSGAQPNDVWVLRDALAAAAEQAGFEPIVYTVLTEDVRPPTGDVHGPSQELGSSATRSIDGAPFEVRLFPDWGNEWSLWPPVSGPTVTELGLSQETLAWLQRWTDFWRSHFRVDREPYWSSQEDQAAWEAEGDALAEQLDRELRGYVVVVSRFR